MDLRQHRCVYESGYVPHNAMGVALSEEVEPFSLEDEGLNEGDTVASPSEDNKSFKQLRDYAKKLEKETQKTQKELERLKAFETEILTERKEKAITSVFTEVGLNPKHAELYKRVNPDVSVDAITAEAVQAFAAEFELATSSGEVPEAPVQESAGFTPVITGTAPQSKKLERDDLLKALDNEDYEAVKRAFETGRVQTNVPWKTNRG